MSIVGVADHISQEHILREIMRRDPGAFFITEENVNNLMFSSHLIGVRNLELLKANGAYIIDELDGTHNFIDGGNQWATVVGFVDEGLQHSVGAVYAPMASVLNRPQTSTLFYASRGSGSYIASDSRIFVGGKVVYGKLEVTQTEVKKVAELKKATMAVGIDATRTAKFPVNNKAFLEMGDGVGTTYGTAIACIILQLPYGYLPIYQR